MAKRMSEQIKDWRGQADVPWVVHQARLDQMMLPFGEAAIDAAAPTTGEAVLDIGCGTGATTAQIFDRVGATGRVTGIDISEAMIARARETYGLSSRATFHVADAEQAELSPHPVELIFSRFGVMFFTNPVRAFSRLRQSLSPSGRLAFICWREAGANDWIRLPMGAIRRILPAPPPPPPADAPGPFSFGDRHRVATILQQAGFTDITFQPFDHEIMFGEGDTPEAAIDDAVQMAFDIGPLSRALANESDDVRQQASAAVREAFAHKLRGSAVFINGAAWIVTARNGGDPSAACD
ncbi:class I SAM-dependent methyltransferase [Aurantiacibacter xanthus]|uniref:Class I SAM-dependent methyltransferase n=1 Tax=Aurantiacibacter xanthus TaxID=1784712 RepID=A0A3A1NYZ8_9SPHN|nr:class I SAM-dependent methyltransferase [Aurantiacibacter xanthus]RIV80902.1 class I SAM-dependent methyltransferase [Aurantiacibacter xanthus]